MEQLIFLSQLQSMLRLVGKVPEKLKRWWPGNGWIKVGKIEDEKTKRLFLLQLSLTDRAAKERSKGDLASAHEFQLKAEACEKILHFTIYQQLELFGRFTGIPVIYGAWNVALLRSFQIPKPD